MTMAKPLQHKAAKRGFTLTEIAIVLGIIGLILGAIWVAASAVYNNLRTSRATTELLQIAQAVRSMYATSSSVDPGADMPAAFAASTAAAANATYIAAGVFPSDTLNTGQAATATIVSNPWGGGIAIVATKIAANNDSFAVEYDKVPTPACITLLTANTGSGRDTSMYGTQTTDSGNLPIAGGGAATATNTTLPVTASMAQTNANTKCNRAGTTASVAFQFKVKG